MYKQLIKLFHDASFLEPFGRNSSCMHSHYQYVHSPLHVWVYVSMVTNEIVWEFPFCMPSASSFNIRHVWKLCNTYSCKSLIGVHEMHVECPVNYFCWPMTLFHHQPTLWSPTPIPRLAVLPIKTLVAKQCPTNNYNKVYYAMMSREMAALAEFMLCL